MVIPKKRRNRGTPVPKLLVRWRNITIPCNYSDHLTPPMLIEAIRLNPQIRQDTLAKESLTPFNNLSATLQLHATLRSQGIVAGDIVILVTRHARVYDPYGAEHRVAYRDEDKIHCFLNVLQDISPMSFLSEFVVCHEDSPLEPTLRVQDCHLAQEPTLHVRFRNHLDTYPLQESGCAELTTTAGKVPEGITPQYGVGSKGHPPQTHEPKYGPGDTGMPSPSQVFVTGPGGKTLVLLFRPTDSITTNLLRCSTQLPLPPFADLYIRSGRRTLQIECTGRENGLHHEPRLEISLRCKGGMKGGTYGRPRDKGRGQRAATDSTNGMDGGQITVEHSRTSPEKSERGRGRGAQGSDRRPTLVHAQPQDEMNESDRYALIIARRKNFQTSTSLLCQELWATSRIIPGYAPPPPLQSRKNHWRRGQRRQRDPSQPNYPWNRHPSLL